MRPISPVQLISHHESSPPFIITSHHHHSSPLPPAVITTTTRISLTIKNSVTHHQHHTPPLTHHHTYHHHPHHHHHNSPISPISPIARKSLPLIASYKSTLLNLIISLQLKQTDRRTNRPILQQKALTCIMTPITITGNIMYGNR